MHQLWDLTEPLLPVQILRRVPFEVYSGAVLTALKRSADMSVEEAIQYKVQTSNPELHRQHGMHPHEQTLSAARLTCALL